MPFTPSAKITLELSLDKEGVIYSLIRVETNEGEGKEPIKRGDLFRDQYQARVQERLNNALTTALNDLHRRAKVL